MTCIVLRESFEILEIVFKQFVDDFKWIPEYDKIALWMEGNYGKGLIMYGSNGMGKTIIANKIMPVFFKHFLNRVMKIYDSQEMNEQLDIILEKRLLSIDDIGTEEQKVDYGEKRWAFPELWIL